jgi:hypothetical protein
MVSNPKLLEIDAERAIHLIGATSQYDASARYARFHYVQPVTLSEAENPGDITRVGSMCMSELMMTQSTGKWSRAGRRLRPEIDGNPDPACRIEGPNVLDHRLRLTHRVKMLRPHERSAETTLQCDSAWHVDLPGSSLKWIGSDHARAPGGRGD